MSGILFLLAFIAELAVNCFGETLRFSKAVQLVVLVFFIGTIVYLLYTILKDKDKNYIKYLIGALSAASIVFLYYSFVPQYNYRDTEGYFGGIIVLSGYLCFILLNLITKKAFVKKNINYVFSIMSFLSSCLCMKTLLFYKARLYVFSLMIFVLLMILYFAYHIIQYKNNKSIKISLISACCVSEIVALASTVVRGLYICKMPALAVLCLIMVVLFYDCLLCKNSEEELLFWPYDYETFKNETRETFLKKIKISSSVILSLVVPYLLLGPLEIYVGNMLSFSFGYLTFLPLFIVIGIIVLVVCSILLSLLTKETFKFTIGILSVYSVLSYIQYLFMNTKLMEEDGARLRLDTMGNYPTINLIIWIAVAAILITVVYVLKDKWDKAVVYACLFLSLIQLTAVITLIITCINAPKPRYYQLTGEQQFRVAKDNNVIVLMPDTMSRGKINALLEYDPDYLDILKDFTYYDNLDAEYFPTFPSFAHILTEYDCPEGMDSGVSDERVQWQSDAWNSEKCKNFYKDVHAAGYNVFANITAPCELMGAYLDVNDKVDNAEYAESNVNKATLIKMLFSMSIYRCVPYVFKPPFEYFSWDFAELEQYNGQKPAYKNEDFYAEAIKGITVDDNIENKLHVICWHGFHDGYTNDEYCNPVDEESVSDLQNSMGVMLCIKTYLDDLKEIGRYDDCAIIVMGDHGKPTDLSISFTDIKNADGAVFIKLPNEHHDKTVHNSYPGKYSQLMATMADLVGIDSTSYGESLIGK